MKTFSFFIALSLIIISLQNLTFAQTSEQNTEQNTDLPLTTNALSLKALDHIKGAYKAASDATDKATADAAVVTIQKHLKQLKSLEPAVLNAKQPTNSEMKEFAKEIAVIEEEMKQIMKRMMENMFSQKQQIQSIIEPAMTQFIADTSKIGEKMEQLYPKDKIEPMIKAEKAKLDAKKSD